MNNSDIINGILEILGGLFILPSIFKLYKDKQVKGVSWIAIMFFTLWGYWNIYFYPANGLTLSFYGSLCVSTCNTIWLAQLIYYTYYYGKNSN